MRVLVVGSGGREHALAWRLGQDPAVEAVICAPGNAGTAQVAENVAVDETDGEALVRLARARGVDLAVVGPEAPLVAGVADRLRAAAVAVLGPGAEAARLEASKAFAKERMAEAGVPTAPFVVCDSATEAHARAERLGAPLVVKADGLAGGKGVTVAATLGEAHVAIDEAMAVRRFGAAGDRLVLEAFLPGPEASAFALCDGDRFRVWPLARDHKQLLDGGVGPNTGGMGAITPPPGLGEEARQIVAERVFGPILGAMARRGTPFAGILFAGLKWAADGPSVLEFNVRLGDPETQALVMTMRGSLATALLAAARGTLDERALGFEGAGASVVAAARGYPLRPELGAVIDVGDMGLAPNAAGWAQVFHAGTALGPGGLVVAGGRVLSVAASGATIAEARARAYQRLAHIRFDGMHARRDVGLG